MPPDPGPIGWAFALPLLVAGAGSGVVISPNTHAHARRGHVARAGSAAGVLQTSQRVGSAAGIAAVGAAFFAARGSLDGGAAAWRSALAAGLAVAIGFVVLALPPAVWDLRRRRREGRH